ncbi:MAG: hypothetical protein KAH32_04145 [Chlamydiia bacterium]|nr:hypothetical protein [Chlamydiia bacterium]
MLRKNSYEIVIKEWKNSVPMGISKNTFYGEKSKLPAKYVKNSVLKKFGKKNYWVDKDTKIRLIRTKGKAIKWNLNGQAFYSASIHWTARTKIVKFYHKEFAKYIADVVQKPFEIYQDYGLSISVDIYEIFTKFTPDVTNMWLLEKMFEDTLQEMGLLRDDNPEFVIESGRKRYHWVNKPEDRKLIFKLKYIKR